MSPPRFLVLSIGKRAALHHAALQALSDLTADSQRRVTGVRDGAAAVAAAELRSHRRLSAYPEMLAKARRFLTRALPAADFHLVTADTPDLAARAAPAGDGLVLIDAAGTGLATDPFGDALTELAEARGLTVYTEDATETVRVARPYTVRRMPEDPWVLVADIVRMVTDHVQQRHGALRAAARTGRTALAGALHRFLDEQAGPAWGLHYYTGSVVSALIADLERLADGTGNPVLRGPSEHSLACGALARWQLDEAPFLIVATSGMVDEFRGTLANLRDSRARGLIVCADSPAGAWYPFQGTVHGAEDSRAVLAARGIPHVYLDDPATLADGLATAFAAYHQGRGPVVLLATPSVLEASDRYEKPVPALDRRSGAPLQVRDDALAPVLDILNRDPGRLLWQCGHLDAEETGLVHDVARRAGIGLTDSLTRPGGVARYREGRVVPEYLGTLGLYGFSARVHDYLHQDGRLRPRDEQCLFFVKSRLGEAATPFSPRTLRRLLRIVQVTREREHLAPFTDHPVLADARGFLRAVRERLDVAPDVLAARRAALAAARESPSDALHDLPTLPMSANYFFHRLGRALDTLIAEDGYTYTGVYDVGRGGLSAIRNLPRTGPGFSGWYGRALMGDALQAVPAIAGTRDGNVLAFVGDGATALVPDIVPTLVQQVCLYGRRLRGNVTIFRLIDGGHSVIRSYHEGRSGARMSRQTQVLNLLEPEWSRSFGPLTVRHRHIGDVAGIDLRGLLRQEATVTVCSVPLSHNNEGDGLSLLSSLGWQRDEPGPALAAARGS